MFRRYAVEAAVSVLGAGLLVWAWRADAAWATAHLAPDFRMSRRLLAGEIVAVRVIAASAGVLALVVLRPWLGRLAERRSFAALAGAAAPTLVAAVLAIGAAELGLRMLAPRVAAPPAHEEPLRLADPQIGWVVRPGGVTEDVVGGRRVQYAFDAAGLRAPAPGQAIDLARPSVVFAGESVMMGYGLRWPETVPAQVAALTGLEPVNAAMGAYAADQSYLRLQRAWPAVRRPVALVTLFLPGGFYRMLDPERPHLDAQLRWRPARREWRLAHILRRHWPYYPAAQVEAAVEAQRAVLQASARLAHARGATALVLVPVLEPQTAQEAAITQRVLAGSGLQVVRVEIPAAWRLPGDRHPDARGARAMAEAVAAALRNPPPPQT